MKHTIELSLIFILGALCVWSARAESPWPFGDPLNLTAIEGPEPNDFYNDLSGGFWNPETRILWICRNGPGGSNSKLWAIREDGSGSFEIDYQGSDRGEWTGFNDFEGVTQADYSEAVVFAIIEDAQEIREYDVTTYGSKTLINSWSIAAYIPTSGGYGAEGITFVPDQSLTASGFVDASGTPYSSTQGMNGLIFVAHQNGGRIYVFDLNRTYGTLSFVGEYLTSYSESAGLEFDRSTHQLYIWHGGQHNTLEITDLTSTDVGAYRKFDEVITYSQPHGGNLEGIARTESNEPDQWLFLTMDDGGANALDWYDWCYHSGDVDDSGSVTAADAQLTFFFTLGLQEPSIIEACAADCNGDGSVTAADAQQIFLVVLGSVEECSG